MGSPTEDWPIVKQEDDQTYSYYGASSGGVDGLHYVNGYWISSFTKFGGNRPIIVTEEIGGDWQEATATSGGGFFRSVAQGKGSYLATDNAYFYRTNNPTGFWTRESAFTLFGTSSEQVAFDGHWAALTFNNRIYTATNAAGPWTLSANLTPPGATSGFAERLVAADGKWIACVRGDNAPYLWSADKLNGTWTGHGAPGGASNLYGGLGHDGNKYFFADFDSIWRSSTLGGTWTQDLLFADLYPEDDYPYHPYAFYVRYGGGNYVITGRTESFDLFIAAGPSLNDLTIVKANVSGQNSLANGIAFDGEDWMIVGNIDPLGDGVYYATAWATGDGGIGDGWGMVL